MEFTLASVLVVITAFLSGAVAALKYIAPRTKTTKDDAALKTIEDVLEVLPKPKG
jgi:hypothetical protein